LDFKISKNVYGRFLFRVIIIMSPVSIEATIDYQGNYCGDDYIVAMSHRHRSDRCDTKKNDTDGGKAAGEGRGLTSVGDDAEGDDTS